MGPRDRADRSRSQAATSAGIRWASRVSTIGLEFALPPCMGLYLDRLWSTAPILTLVGTFLGFAAGMFQILGIARSESKRIPGRSAEPPPSDPADRTPR